MKKDNWNKAWTPLDPRAKTCTFKDIEPLDLHWRSTRLRDLTGADRSEQREHNREIRMS